MRSMRTVATGSWLALGLAMALQRPGAVGDPPRRQRPAVVGKIERGPRCTGTPARGRGGEGPERNAAGRAVHLDRRRGDLAGRGRGVQRQHVGAAGQRAGEHLRLRDRRAGHDPRHLGSVLLPELLRAVLPPAQHHERRPVRDRRSLQRLDDPDRRQRDRGRFGGLRLAGDAGALQLGRPARPQRAAVRGQPAFQRPRGALRQRPLGAVQPARHRCQRRLPCHLLQQRRARTAGPPRPRRHVVHRPRGRPRRDRRDQRLLLVGGGRRAGRRPLRLRQGLDHQPGARVPPLQQWCVGGAALHRQPADDRR